MKYVVVLGDGMADYPVKELGYKTPLQYANKPNMDKLASSGGGTCEYRALEHEDTWQRYSQHVGFGIRS